MACLRIIPPDRSNSDVDIWQQYHANADASLRLEHSPTAIMPCSPALELPRLSHGTWGETWAYPCLRKHPCHSFMHGSWPGIGCHSRLKAALVLVAAFAGGGFMHSRPQQGFSEIDAQAVDSHPGILPTPGVLHNDCSFLMCLVHHISGYCATQSWRTMDPSRPLPPMQ